MYEYPQCETCLAGTFREQGDLVDGPTTVCDACPALTYSFATASECTGWTPCSAGEYLVGASNTQDGVCTQCDAGTFQPDANSTATSCSACADGYSAAGASTCTPWSTCDAGERFTTGTSTSDSSCSPCDAVPFSPTQKAPQRLVVRVERESTNPPPVPPAVWSVPMVRTPTWNKVLPVRTRRYAKRQHIFFY